MAQLVKEKNIDVPVVSLYITYLCPVSVCLGKTDFYKNFIIIIIIIIILTTICNTIYQYYSVI